MSGGTLVGRPKKEDARRATISTRVTDELRKAIGEASKKTGRSLAQEIEFRLERSFRDDEIIERLDRIEGCVRS